MNAGERWRPSVTVAAVVADRGRYLVVEEHTSHGLMLNNPAGHLEEGESPQQGVVREALEETARHFTPEALVGVYLSRSTSGVTYLRLAFSGTVGETIAGRALDTGIVRTLWLTPDELRAGRARHRSPLLLRGVEDHLAGRRYPLDVVVTAPDVFGPR